MMNTKDMVAYLLQHKPETRDCDIKLMSVIYRRLCDGKDFFTEFEAKRLPSPETIRRWRAKHQEENEELRGNNYILRHKSQIRVQQQLGYNV
jgi:hypothetical protein